MVTSLTITSQCINPSNHYILVWLPLHPLNPGEIAPPIIISWCAYTSNHYILMRLHHYNILRTTHHYIQELSTPPTHYILEQLSS